MKTSASRPSLVANILYSMGILYKVDNNILRLLTYRFSEQVATIILGPLHIVEVSIVTPQDLIDFFDNVFH